VEALESELWLFVAGCTCDTRLQPSPLRRVEDFSQKFVEGILRTGWRSLAGSGDSNIPLRGLSSARKQWIGVLVGCRCKTGHPLESIKTSPYSSFRKSLEEFFRDLRTISWSFATESGGPRQASVNIRVRARVKDVAPNIVFWVSNLDAAITSATPGLEILIAGWGE
jgi:hypothetical protein